MSSVQEIQKALQERRSYPIGLTLKDVIAEPCSYRHHLQLIGEEPSAPQTPEEILLRDAGHAIRKWFRGYFAGAFEENFKTPEPLSFEGIIYEEVDGFLYGDSLVEIVPLSARAYTKAKSPADIPMQAAIIAATKAYLTERDHITMLLIERNVPKWSAWTITGDFEETAKAVLEEVNRVVSYAFEDIEEPWGYQTRCSKCPYENSCEAQRRSERAPVIPTGGLQVKPDTGLVNDLDKYLWNLNKKSSGRKTKCIHPSEFASTKCDRRIAYELMGVTRKENIKPLVRRIFDVGHCFHDILQTAMGWAHGDDFVAEVYVDIPGLQITGSCDGVIQSSGKADEYKTISSNQFPKLSQAKIEHKKQATMYAVGLELGSCEYVYASKDTGELKGFEMPIDKKLWHKMAARATRIIKTVEQDELPPPIDNYSCVECPFAWECKPASRRKR